MGFGLTSPYFFLYFLFSFNNIFYVQMIVVTWGVSLAEMSSCVVMPNMKVLYKKKNQVVQWEEIIYPCQSKNKWVNDENYWAKINFSHVLLSD